MSESERIRYLEAQLEEWRAIGQQLLAIDMQVHPEGIVRVYCWSCGHVDSHTTTCLTGRMQALLEAQK